MSGNLCRRLLAWITADKNRCIKYTVVLIMLILGSVLLIKDYWMSTMEIQNGIRRNTYGAGTKTQELNVWMDENEKTEVLVEVSEQMYTDDETKEMFRKCIRQIEKGMLGENESLDHVTSDLNLMSELEGEPVEIEWRLDHYDVMNIYGEIQTEAVEDMGTAVKLEAVLTYTENSDMQSIYQCMARIYPKKLTSEEEKQKEIIEEIQKKDEETRTEQYLKLPQKMEGKKVTYYKKMDLRGIVLIIMAVLAGILFYAQEIQNRGQDMKKRQKQMLMDYPEIINKLTLYLGAGMNLKRAFRKIAADYEVSKGRLGIRSAYEEMLLCCREMESGICEAESYERFGKRCNMPEYIRFGALLSQNMRRGTKGLNQVLKMEALQAFENRKMAAKKFGEEAGTKLLVPMFIMFGVVLIMVIVPAFLSMQK